MAPRVKKIIQIIENLNRIQTLIERYKINDHYSLDHHKEIYHALRDCAHQIYEIFINYNQFTRTVRQQYRKYRAQLGHTTDSLKKNNIETGFDDLPSEILWKEHFLKKH